MRTMPRPMGCLAITVMSPGPETVKVMLVSRPLSENMQMSAFAVPLDGRCSAIGLPPSVQELLTVENGPIAARFRSTSSSGSETPAVVGSTTTMSCAVAVGAPLVSEITSSETFGAATTSETPFELVPSGFCI